MTITGKRILLADDDEDFRPALKLALEQSGHRVLLAAGGRIGQYILAAEPVDLLVSDIRMPDGDGLDLVRFARLTRPELPIILITGFADLLETQQAHELGVNGFLAKPFDLKDLLAAIAACFLPPPAAPEVPLETQFCKVSLVEFISGSGIPCDIYIRLSSEKYVKIAEKGQSLPTEQIQRYKSKGVAHLHVRKAEFAAYIGMNLKLAQAVKASAGISRERKLRFMKHATEVVLERIYSDEIKEECFDHARSVLETSVSLLADDAGAFSLLELLNSHSDDLYAHSLGVSMYSTMIAHQLRWHSPQTIYKLSFGGLFHDIGKKEIDRALLEKFRMDMTEEERRIYETHCVRGLEILGQTMSIPSDVLQIALQHHEDCLGQGFPSGLKKQSIHPLARVTAVANLFCNLAIKSQRCSGRTPREAVERLLSAFSEALDPAFVGGLLKVFKFDLPPHFAEELRKRIGD